MHISAIATILRFFIRRQTAVIVMIMAFALNGDARSETAGPDTLREKMHQARLIAYTDMDSAALLLDDVIRQCRAHSFYSVLFEAYFLQGAIYVNLTEYEKAKENYFRAFRLSVHTANPNKNLCRTFNNLGNVYQFQGDFPQAAHYYYNAARMALPYAKNDSNIQDQLIRIYNNISYSLIQMKQYHKALYYLKKADTLAERSSFFIGRRASTWNNMGIVYNKTGNTQKAWAYHQKALDLEKQLGTQPQDKAIALNGLADILIVTQKPAQAIPKLNEVAGQHDISPYYKAKAFYLMGLAYAAMNDEEKTEASLRQAMAFGEKSRSPDILLQIHRELAGVYERTGKYDGSMKHLKAAYLINDSLLNKEKANAVHQLEVNYRTLQKDNEIAQNRLQINKQQNQLHRKNTLIIGTCSGIIILIILLLVIRRNYRQKIRLQRKQQEIDMLKASMKGEENERARIGHELHDGISGMITAVKMNFTAVQNTYPFLRNAPQFHGAMKLLEETAHEVRHTAHNLTPEILVQHELPDAVEHFCRQMHKSSGIDISFLAYGSFEQLNDEFKLPVYRITQELINNAVKHAQAAHIIVQLSNHNDTFNLTVEDDGIGIAPCPKKNGIGLQHLQARVKSLDGMLTIESTPGKGTTIYVEFVVSSRQQASTSKYSAS